MTGIYRRPARRTVEEWATGASPSLPPTPSRPLWLRVTLIVVTLVVVGFVGYWLIVGYLGAVLLIVVMLAMTGIGGAIFRGGRAL